MGKDIGRVTGNLVFFGVSDFSSFQKETSNYDGNALLCCWNYIKLIITTLSDTCYFFKQ